MIHQVPTHVISIYGLCTYRAVCASCWVILSLRPEKQQTPWNFWLYGTYSRPRTSTSQRGLLPLISMILWKIDVHPFSFAGRCWCAVALPRRQRPNDCRPVHWNHVGAECWSQMTTRLPCCNCGLHMLRVVSERVDRFKGDIALRQTESKNPSRLRRQHSLCASGFL